MKALLFLLLLLGIARAEIACQAATQVALAAGGSQAVELAAAYAPGSCQCSFLPHPGANITCCTDETWAPAATDVLGACRCSFFAYLPIPAATFDFYACADVLL